MKFFSNRNVFGLALVLSLGAPVVTKSMYGENPDIGKALATSIFIFPFAYLVAYYFLVISANRIINEENEKFEAEKKEALDRIGMNGFTELMASAVTSDLEKIKQLIANGCNVNEVDEKGYTALMYAASNGRLESVRLLLSLGADKKIATKKGNTAIYFADLNEHWDTKKLLK
jgi:ankyrin repeat protein